MSRKPLSARDTFRMLYDAHFPSGGVAAAVAKEHLEPLEPDEVAAAAAEYRRDNIHGAGEAGTPREPLSESDKTWRDIQIRREIFAPFARAMKPRTESPPAAKPRRDHVKHRQRELESLFTEIERRAKADGIDYRRSETPGDSKQFYRFLEKWDLKLAGLLNLSRDRLMDELHAVGARFLPGNHKANGAAFYRTLFPEIQ